MMKAILRLGVTLLALTAAWRADAAPAARVLYERAVQKEEALRPTLARDNPPRGVLVAGRELIVSYERLVRLYPRSGYSDNALWQAAELAAALWAQFGEDEDRRHALRLYSRIPREYPSSSLARRPRAEIARLQSAARHARKSPVPEPFAQPASLEGSRPRLTERTATASHGLAQIRDIRRTVMPDSVRVIVELDREVAYREQRITQPDRVFLDLHGVRPSGDLRLPQYFEDGFVKQIRLGQHPDDTIRVVLDVDGTARHSVFALYSPYRLVIDCDRRPSHRVALPPEPQIVPSAAAGEIASTIGTLEDVAAPPAPLPSAKKNERVSPLPSRDTPVSVPTGPPSANLRGRFSLARQLGLGVARIVIDPGHGGRDPGARSKTLTEADLVLDVALRLEQLLMKQPGFEVVLTRRSDVYVPLEERTALANREDADLFLSIHANASRNRQARGVETYFLNFATNADAEAVAARENAASDQTMHRLPDIVKAITLNNKLDESRDFATFVQQSMIGRLRTTNRDVRDLGVKQAPFVVLIGAGMPSVLAEISFLTNSGEAKLLQSTAYRQRIAEALLAGVLKYQKSLKSVRSVAQSD